MPQCYNATAAVVQFYFKPPTLVAHPVAWSPILRRCLITTVVVCPSPTVQRCHSAKVLKCHCAPVHTTVLHRPTTMPGYHSGVPQCHSATTMPGCHSTTVPQCYDVATEATPKPAQRGEERTNHQLECGKSGRNQTMLFSLDFIA